MPSTMPWFALFVLAAGLSGSSFVILIADADSMTVLQGLALFSITLLGGVLMLLAAVLDRVDLLRIDIKRLIGDSELRRQVDQLAHDAHTEMLIEAEVQRRVADAAKRMTV